MVPAGPQAHRMTDPAPPSSSVDISGIARRAVPFGLPTVDLHRILVNFALDPRSAEFKAPLNQIHHARALADPNDRSVVAMNVDTPLLLRLARPPHRSGPADHAAALAGAVHVRADRRSLHLHRRLRLAPHGREPRRHVT